MGLDADPSKEKLQEFVRCAAMELESRAFVFPPDPSRAGGVETEALADHGDDHVLHLAPTRDLKS